MENDKIKIMKQKLRKIILWLKNKHEHDEKRKKVLSLYENVEMSDNARKFIQHYDLIIELLNSAESTKTQHKEFCKRASMSISYDTYLRFCRIFFKRQYRKSIDTYIFKKASFAIVQMYSNDILKSSQMYAELLKKGSLKRARSKADSNIPYSFFKTALREFFPQKDYPEIEFDDLTQSQKEIIEDIAGKKGENDEKKIQ